MVQRGPQRRQSSAPAGFRHIPTTASSALASEPRQVLPVTRPDREVFMKFSAVVLVLGAMATLMACAGSEPLAATADVRTTQSSSLANTSDTPTTVSAAGSALRGDDLRKALSGRDLSLGAGAFERFCASGDWLAIGTRTPRRGTYTISGNLFCVQSSQTDRQCRELRQNGSSQYSVRYVDLPEEQDGTDAPVTLSPSPDC